MYDGKFEINFGLSFNSMQKLIESEYFDEYIDLLFKYNYDK